MAIQVSNPKGTRDFSASTLVKRKFIINTIQEVFELNCFEALETPALENLETLTGKYGEEGDKLMFKIRSNRNIMPADASLAKDLKDILQKIKGADENFLPNKSDLALRYDLTIPFARYVVANRNEITFPYKRYQIQPVWRADNPQAGRFREFYQCDADIIGSTSLLNEVALINIYIAVFEKLKFQNIVIKINNRKILAALSEKINAPEKLTSITIAIDKLDKIGIGGVCDELKNNNFSDEQINNIQEFLNINNLDNNDIKIQSLINFFKDNSTASIGLAELQEVLKNVQASATINVAIDTTLARGLHYYTGCIMEVKCNDISIGSIGGGGRYDNLTGNFGLPNVSGVGISFGLDRIYYAMDQLQMFPDFIQSKNQVLIINFSATHYSIYAQTLKAIHNSGIAAELYPNPDKIKKQMEYSNKKKFNWVILIGDEEIANNKFQLKNMNSGEQYALGVSEIIEKIKTV